MISTTALYIFVTLLSVTAYPPEYRSLLEYIGAHGDIPGIKGLPAFYAAERCLGRAGIYILAAALISLIVMSLFGNIIALSRLLYAMAKDGVLPGSVSSVNEKNIPEKAVGVIAAISLIIPFLGRTATGWIVDVTTIGATIIYGFVSAAAMRAASAAGDEVIKRSGAAGTVLMTVIAVFLLFPVMFSSYAMETESYLLFTVWAALGFIAFRRILRKDRSGKFGKSVIVWVALLLLVIITSLAWMGRSSRAAADAAAGSIISYYEKQAASAAPLHNETAFVNQEMDGVYRSGMRNNILAFALFMFSLAIMVNNYTLMSKREKEQERALCAAKEAANRDPMTGVKSKHAYMERVDDLNAQINNGKAPPFSVVVCDVNDLKRVNDTLGHKAGDEIIRSASVIICEHYKQSPVFRVGGDEFAVILTGGRDYDSRAELLKELDERSAANKALGKVVISAGMSDFAPGADESFTTVFERADAAMYERKKELKAMSAAKRD